MTATTIGIHHLGLTVPDIVETRTFFVEQLGFEQVGEQPTYPAVFISDGTVMLTLWQAQDPGGATAFDRKCCIGLHHLALRVADSKALDELGARLTEHPEVIIEFSAEALGNSGARHMMCSIPGGLRVEFIALP